MYYSRDQLVLFALSLIKPRAALAYEAHTLAVGRFGRGLQRRVVRRVGQVFAVTQKLADDLIALGADARSHPRRPRRHPSGSLRRRARSSGGAPRDRLVATKPFVVGYVGRLQTMAMDKGVGVLVEALAQVANDNVAAARSARRRTGRSGGGTARRAGANSVSRDATFLYAGQVAPDRVPLYLSAFDVCAMPFPWTTHFAYYASPIKLFEYMASGRALVASDLPSIAEVVADGESALLTPPSDVEALADAIRRLRDDPALRQRLAANAQAIVHGVATRGTRARKRSGFERESVSDERPLQPASRAPTHRLVDGGPDAQGRLGALLPEPRPRAARRGSRR